MPHKCHFNLQKAAVRCTESDQLWLCRHASMTHQLAARNTLRALELPAAYGSASMIPRSVALRALALCDAANVRLPILELHLARGLVSACQPASELCRKIHICSAPRYDSFSVLQGDIILTSIGHSRITQSRQLSSEAAFREYGRNFGDGKRVSDGTAVPHDQGTAESIPEGLDKDVEDMEGEQQESKDETEMRQQLLKAALKHVKENGWSVAALQAAASELGLSRAASGMVPNGAAGLVEYFVDDCNQRLVDVLEERREELAALRTPQRVRLALQARLQMLIPFMDSWPQALAVQASPAHMSTMFRQRAELVDDIWHACGDTATDYKWYTKRGLLAGVYAATELFMITDYSPGYADTWKSLDRRLEDVKRFGNTATEVRQYANGLLKNIGSLAEWAQEALVNVQKDRQQRTRP